MITYCGMTNCKNDFQDKTYGINFRVHNLCGKEKAFVRCTVCGNKKQVKGTESKEKEKEKGK